MVPLFKPYMPTELPELDAILHSGALSYGKWGKLFEQKLGDYIGEPRITAVNSYNSAMLVALAVIGIKSGDEIIASPMSCLASNQPFATQGAKVVWADIDPSTGTLDPDSVRSKISSKTKAIFHNHYCGYVGYVDEINAIGKEKEIIVVDDAIEAFGSEYKGKQMGNLGTDITIFSFQTVRLPNTIDGGALAFKNDNLFKKANLVRDLGIDRSRFRDELGEISPNCDISIPGFGATLNEVSSYIGCLQMNDIKKLINIQEFNGDKWIKWFNKNYPEVKVLSLQNDIKPNFWIFGILAENKKDLIIDMRNKGFYASGIHLNNNGYSVFGKQSELKGVNEFYKNFLAIPCGWWVEC